MWFRVLDRIDEANRQESDSAYNDMCYLCEEYAPLEGLGKYDSEKDPSVTGARIQVHT